MKNNYILLNFKTGNFFVTDYATISNYYYNKYFNSRISESYINKIKLIKFFFYLLFSISIPDKFIWRVLISKLSVHDAKAFDRFLHLSTEIILSNLLELIHSRVFFFFFFFLRAIAFESHLLEYQCISKNHKRFICRTPLRKRHLVLRL